MTRNLTFIILLFGITIASCKTARDGHDTTQQTEIPCFQGVQEVKAEPVRIDTSIVFDSETYEESCTVKTYYTEVAFGPDSVFIEGDMTIGLVKGEECYILLSIEQPGGCD